MHSKFQYQTAVWVSFFKKNVTAHRFPRVHRRASAIAVSAMGLTKHLAPGVTSEGLQNAVMFAAFAFAFCYYLLFINPYR